MNDDVLFDLKQSSGSDSEAAEVTLMPEDKKIEEEVPVNAPISVPSESMSASFTPHVS